MGPRPHPNEKHLFKDENLFTILFQTCLNKNDIKCLIFKKNLLYFAAKQMGYEYSLYYTSSFLKINRVVGHVAFVGDLPLLKFIIANGNYKSSEFYHYDYDSSLELNSNRHIFYMIEYASLGGHIEMVKHLTNNKPNPLHIRATIYAAAGGHLELLKYLHGNGYPWEHDGYIKHCAREAFSDAVRFGHLHVINYLLEYGCPTDPCALEIAKYMGHKDIYNYLIWIIKK